jgi:hypothetical protein
MPASSRSKESTSVEAEDGGSVEYIDLGDRTLVIDNSGPVQRREVLPKALRDIGVTPQMRQELEARIEGEQAVAAAAAADAERDPTEDLPPAEDYEAVQAREAAEAVAKANEAQSAGGGEQVVEVTATPTPPATDS